MDALCSMAVLVSLKDRSNARVSSAFRGIARPNIGPLSLDLPQILPDAETKEAN
jgi:hypothetical protein